MNICICASRNRPSKTKVNLILFRSPLSSEVPASRNLFGPAGWHGSENKTPINSLPHGHKSTLLVKSERQRQVHNS